MSENTSALIELVDAYYIADAKLRTEHTRRLEIADSIEGVSAHPSYLGLQKLQDEERSSLADEIFGGHFVRQSEIDAVCSGRPMVNGCTNSYLGEKYGERLSHIMGVGWFIDRPEATSRPVQLSLV